jgi:aromatic ring hydroxylase
MPARTGQEYLNGLKATNREMWLGGERVESVNDHPLLAPGAHAIAAYFDLQHQRPDELLMPDPETGESINVTSAPWKCSAKCSDTSRSPVMHLSAVADVDALSLYP